MSKYFPLIFIFGYFYRRYTVGVGIMNQERGQVETLAFSYFL